MYIKLGTDFLFYDINELFLEFLILCENFGNALFQVKFNLKNAISFYFELFHMNDYIS